VLEASAAGVLARKAAACSATGPDEAAGAGAVPVIDFHPAAAGHFIEQQGACATEAIQAGVAPRQRMRIS